MEATLLVVGLEKAIAKMENSMLMCQAYRVAPLLTFPTFDGSGALTWLARANQYFFFNKTPLDRRVDVAMIAINGPAKPWKQLLVRRCPSLSWDRFVRELLNRFGDTTASGSTPPMTLPTFDGSDVIAWLARAEQHFLVSKIPPENRLSAAMVILAGPALPWIQLLMRRIPTLSWDRFTHEMMNRFGGTIPQESCVPCNSSKQGSEGPIVAVHVAKNQPTIPPTPSNNTAAILPTVTASLLPLSHDILSFQPPSIPLPEHKLIPATTTFQSTPTASLSESIHAPACPVRNVSRPSSAAASHIQHFLSADNERSNKLHLLLHVYGQISVCTLTSDCKHEYDPPPTMYCVFGFQIQPCGQGCFESEAVDTDGVWKGYTRGSRRVVYPTEREDIEEEVQQTESEKMVE